jgi:hypothetical protein
LAPALHGHDSPGGSPAFKEHFSMAIRLDAPFWGVVVAGALASACATFIALAAGVLG